MGTTDVGGSFTYSMVEQTSNIGNYTQVWSVGSIQISPALTFVVGDGQLGTGGAVTMTSTGQTTGGSVTGVSYLSISSGTITTYSATELSPTASLYYDAQTVATLYDEGTPVLQGFTPVDYGTAGRIIDG